MIPSLGRTIEFYAYLHRARGYTDHDLTAGDLGGALAHAGRLATGEADEPAALFFAFARMVAPLGQAWPLFPILLGRNHAATRGLALRATDEELAELARDVCYEGLPFDHVRQWFHERMR